MDKDAKRGYLTEDFRIFHLSGALNVRVEPHYHEFHKLFMLCSGSGGYEIEGRRYRLNKGDVVLVGSRCVHCPDFGDSPYERVILYISPELLERNSTPDCQLSRCFSGEHGYVLRLGEEGQKRLFDMAKEIECEDSGKDAGHSILSRCMLLRLMVELFRYTENGGLQMPMHIEPKDKKMLEIVRYIDEHFSEAISVDDIARRFYMSRYHMMHRFRAELGSSMHEYIVERRLLYARDLIEKGCSATDACFYSGFGSYSAFSRAYMKLFSNTPTGRAGTGARGFIVE